MAQDFCASLTGAMLEACQGIPASCVSIHAPRFIDTIGDHTLFLAMRDVVRKAKLGSHNFFVLGPGRGTTATHTVALAASAGNRTVVHFHDPYHDGKSLLGIPGVHVRQAADLLIKAQHDFLHNFRSNREPLMFSTTKLIKPMITSLTSLVMKSYVTGFFDTPWVDFFTELFYATCPRGVHVVFSTRDSLAWAKSRQEHHRVLQETSPEMRRLSSIGFVCPFALDPRLLDPFSLVQCAAFARRFQAPGSKINESQEIAPRLSGSAALDFNDVGTLTLAAAMHKYNQYVHRLVPEDLLLQVNIFNGLLQEKPNSGAFFELEKKLIATFVETDSYPHPHP
eukprot:CAMPEP_0119300842 /NCGR_PEP_ID=MMETSP1333-20130426/2727_1 /TAXON_ID=418940 /ORGANISM="Scyphosphaera apsteinii, Strain RCC1455" /LENGTH=337 /DNA_ID=CAMNT_0007302747 /DNA_START=115 /DNA_END=1124 /DNA_ORIENTATION=+